MIYSNNMFTRRWCCSAEKRLEINWNCFDSIKCLEQGTTQMEVFYMKTYWSFREELNINVEKYRSSKSFVTLADTFQHLCTGLFCCLGLFDMSQKGLNFQSFLDLVFQAVWCRCNDKYFTGFMMSDCDKIEFDPFCLLRKQDNHWMVKVYRPVTITTIQ